MEKLINKISELENTLIELNATLDIEIAKNNFLQTTLQEEHKARIKLTNENEDLKHALDDVAEEPKECTKNTFDNLKPIE